MDEMLSEEEENDPKPATLYIIYISMISATPIHHLKNIKNQVYNKTHERRTEVLLDLSVKKVLSERQKTAQLLS